MADQRSSRDARRSEAVKRSMKRDARNTKSFGLGYALLAVIALLAVVLLAFTVFFKVEHVTVEGNSRYTAEEIQSASGFKKGDNLYLFDKPSVREKMLKSLPYLESVQIKRRLPDTIAITVVEAVPAASIASDGGTWLVSSEGKLLEYVNTPDGAAAVSTDETSWFDAIAAAGAKTATDAAKTSDAGEESGTAKVPDGLIELRGISLEEPAAGEKFATADDALTPYLALMDAFDSYGMTGVINYIDFSESYDIKFMYDGRLLVNTGLPDDITSKMRYFDQVLGKLDKYSRGLVDLSDDRIRYVPKEVRYEAEGAVSDAQSSTATSETQDDSTASTGGDTADAQNSENSDDVTDDASSVG